MKRINTLVQKALIVSLPVLVLPACSVDGVESSSNDPTYDLKEYLVPETSNTLSYSASEKQGDGSYAANSYTETFIVSRTETDIDRWIHSDKESTIFECSLTNLNIICGLQGSENKKNYSRNVSIGDTFYSKLDKSESGAVSSYEIHEYCMVDSYELSKEFDIDGQAYGPYTDLLVVECSQTATNTLLGETTTISKSDTRYLAKGIGEVYSENYKDGILESKSALVVAP